MLSQSLWSFFLVLLLIGCATEQESSVVEVSHPPVSQAVVDSIRNATIQDIVDSIVATLPAESEPLEDLYERACEGVYLIYVIKEDGELSQGTCFLIASSGLMITNYHVVVDGIYTVVIDRYGREFAIDTFLTYSEENDFAVFQLAQPFQGGTVLSIAKELPRIGEASFAIGNPLGLTQTLSTGIISGFRDNSNIIQTTAEFTFGSSGGPLFNRRGEVIGITTAINGDANLNFAMNIRLVPLSDLIGMQEEPLDAGGGTTPGRTRVKAALEN